MIDFELSISKGLSGYKSRPHLPRGSEGAAQQATQREALLAKKKEGKKARRRFEKEKEISRWVRGGESRSDMEAELESEEPMEMGGNASASEDEGDRGAVMTSMEHHEPTTASVGDGCDTKMRYDVPKSRKHATSEDTAVEQEAKRARSLCPSEASLAPHPLAPSVVEHASQSGGHDRSPASSRSAHVHDPHRGDAPPVALVVSPQVGGHDHSWADRGLAGLAPSSADMRWHGS